MSQLTIAVIVGSLRKQSFNQQLAHGLEKLLPDGVAFDYLRIDDLPLYNQDDDNDQPAPVKRLKQAVRDADGVLFATPEYNRSIPGVLKNVLDHASRPYGDSAWNGKPAGMIGTSPGAIGTACAQFSLRPILSYLNMPLFNQPEIYVQMRDGFFDKDGSIGAGSREFLQGWLDGFVAWVRQHAG